VSFFILARPVLPAQPPLVLVGVAGCVGAPPLRRTALITSEVFRKSNFLYNKVELEHFI
jgi:hypothetical protein